MSGLTSGFRGLFSRALIFSAAAAAIGFFGLPLTSSTALAQQVSGKILDEITVNVRRREETVKDVPATVFVFTEESIERSNITRAADIALLTPGVSLVDAAEVGDTQVNIRGMNGARDAENSYALVIDGITMTNPAALNREYVNLQQIEVLKGPQGAIYGRNASAGAFVINTKRPGEEFGGSLIASAAEDATYRLVGAVDGPIGDTLGGTLTADYRTTDGFYFNDYLGRDDITDNLETWSIGGRLIWDPTENLSIDTKLRYGEVDGSSIAFNSIFQLPGARGFLGPFAYEDVNTHDFRFYSNVVHFNEQDSTEFSIKLDWDMDWATLTTWGLYSDINNNLGADGTSAAFGFFNTEQSCIDTTAALGAAGAAFPINPPQAIGDVPANSLLGAYTPTACDGTQYQQRDQQDVSLEIRLTSPGDEAFRWNAGLYFLNIDREVAVNTGIDRLNAGATIPPAYTNAKPIAQIYQPNAIAGAVGATNPTEQLAWDQFDTDVYSVFGGVAWDFTESWTADFALRYDREERKVTNKVPYDPVNVQALYIASCPGGSVNPMPLNPGQCDGPIAPKSENFDEWQPKFSLTWDINDQWTTFGSVGVGFRSGGFNNSGSKATVDLFINSLAGGLCDPRTGGQACIDSGLSRVDIQDTYRKETATAAELGFKSNLFDNAVALEGAVYYTEVDDMQFFEFIVGGFGLLRVVENIDEVEIKGIEVAGTWNATEWLDLFLGWNWTDSEIKKNTTRWDTVGNRSPYTPRYTGNLGAYVNLPVSSTWDFFTNLDVSTVGATWFHAIQVQERPTGFGLPSLMDIARRDNYTLSNIRLGLQTETIAVAVFATNLTDEKWLQEVIPAPEFGGSFAHVATERRIGADVTWRF